MPGDRVHTLAIVSHVVHYQYADQIFAYGPYSREIDIWADLFPQVVVAAPVRYDAPPADCLPFTRRNISVAPQIEAGGDALGAKVALAAALPVLVWGLARALSEADAIHVRCPGNLGLLGVLLAPMFSRRLVAKYAGQWNGYAGEPVTVRFQRRVLRSRWWHGPVTVYGEWPGQPAHVVPFFTSMMTSQQVAAAVEHAANKQIHTPLRVLYSGVLTSRKRVSALLDGVKCAVMAGLKLDVAIVGTGPEEGALRDQAAALGIEHLVKFVGALPFDRALRWYEWSDCLVLPSRHSEGWPKVVAEAMTYGVVPIAVRHGQIPAMLAGRGVVLPSGTGEEIAAALHDVSVRPSEFREVSERASQWARQFSLEGLRAALSRLLSEHWHLQPPALTPQLVNHRTHV